MSTVINIRFIKFLYSFRRSKNTKWNKFILYLVFSCYKSWNRDKWLYRKEIIRVLSECAKNLVESSWAVSTRNSYNSYIKRWTEYCAWKGISASRASVTEGVNYLSHLFQQGEKDGYIAGTQSALSAILLTVDGKTFGNQELV